MLTKIGYIVFIMFILLPLSLENAYSIEGIINGSLTEMYDDNIYSSENKEYDLITEVLLALGVRHQGNTMNWRLVGQTTQQIYSKNNELNNNSQSAELNIEKEFSSTDRIAILETFGHYPEANDFKNQFGLAGGRTGYYTNTTTVTYITEIMSYFSINIYYTNIYRKVLGNIQNDSILHRTGINGRYEFNPHNIVFAFYNYIYLKPLSDNETENDESKLHNVGFGYEYHFTQQLFLSFQSGIEYVRTSSEKNYNMFGTLSLTDQIDQRNNLNISASRRYEITPLTNQVYDIWNLSLTFTRELSYLLSFSSSGFYQYGNEISEISTTKSQLMGVRAGLSYILFSEHVNAVIEYIYTRSGIKQTTPTTLQVDYDRNQIRLTIRAEI